METTTTTYDENQKIALITSMCGPLMNRIKLLIQNPQKNKQLAQNAHLNSLIECIAEHLLPQYCVSNFQNPKKLQIMHSLCFLLASKIQSVFTSGVIRTCIDQNWDLKGYKSVLIRILQEMGLEADDYKKIQEFFDKMIQSQNLQSLSCIKATSQYLRKANKTNIDEDDLKNPIVSFQTSFQFVKEEIEKFRAQNMNHSCFTVLHPWAYDLDLVDFKYVINRDQTHKITSALSGSQDAQVMWLSYFKSQLSASADEFFGALKEISIMNHVQDAFEANHNVYKIFMLSNNFVVSLNDHADQINQFVSQIIGSSDLNVLRDQLRLTQGSRQPTEYVDENRFFKNFKISTEPDYDVLHQFVKETNLVQLTPDQVKVNLNLKRHVFKIKPVQEQNSNLFLKFTNVDTDELKDLEIKFDGNLAQFKVGEGDCNHFVISNDKKLWESQFMIIQKDGQYYIRDLGIVHTSRVKVNSQTALQIHQGALLDLGKVVHYHVDKLIHEAVPNQESNPNFIVMKGTQANYKVDDEAILRARPTWISADENKDLVQNEIILENNEKSVFSVGRSNRRDVEIRLKAVSADHCKIEYNREVGWFIHENKKDRLSSNGTFVFMKSLQQMDDHEPSDLIPLFNGMTVSFINYELQVRIEPKNSDEQAANQYETVDLTPIERPQSSRSQVSAKQEAQSQVSKQASLRSQRSQAQNESVYDDSMGATKKQNNDSSAIMEDQKSNRSVVSQKSLQQVASQHEEDQGANDQEEEVKSQRSNHSASQKSLRQSVQSVKQNQSINGDPEVDNEEQNDNPAQEEEVRQSIASQRSHRSQASAKQSVVQNDEDQPVVEEQQDEAQVYQEEASPKGSVAKSQKDEEEEQKQEIQRSFSQHHIGEVDDGMNASIRSAKHQLIHSDDEEDQQDKADQNKSVHESAKGSVKGSVRGSVQGSVKGSVQGSVHGGDDEAQQEELKSQRSIKSLKSAKQSVAQEEQQEQPNDDAQEEAQAQADDDQKSMKSASKQSLHEPSVRGSIQGSVHNQSVHYEDDGNVYDKQSIHEPSVHEQSQRSIVQAQEEQADNQQQEEQQQEQEEVQKQEEDQNQEEEQQQEQEQATSHHTASVHESQHQDADEQPPAEQENEGQAQQENGGEGGDAQE
ncbi:UNKNOWN [Stylonychia lemnae]|uniref:FHA domain-containing protein n=1 Tax=Stylonychia lemnae TaxID=5949 RepID=A0A077ZZQ9_STYLE|nr:UNKNOWN [Stylonychia lemnae]|eukprot:CDW75107.1 UNKNOWN [Stylonychia lemnae]